MSTPSNAALQSSLDETVESFPHEACLTCECFLGLVAQLYGDVDANGKQILKAYKVDRKNMHACLGCDPCPPGDKYAKYIRQKQAEKIITL